MKKEKFILSIVAGIVGLVVAGGTFYLYQAGKEINPKEIESIVVTTPTPKASGTIFLAIAKPANEEVSTSKSVQINGKTQSDAKILIISTTGQETATPASDGSFSTTITLDENENLIEFIAIAPNGEIATERLVISITTEDF